MTGSMIRAVKARMDAMSVIGAQMKVLGNMAKGQVAFDASAAQAAAALVAEQAAAVPALFETQVDDPKSEADPAIWTNYPDFSAKAGRLARRGPDSGRVDVQS